MWDDLPKDDIRNTIISVMRGEENVTTFVNYEIFLEKLNMVDTTAHRDFYYECQHVFFMYIMKWAGNWELSWDVFGDTTIELTPIKLVVISISESNHTSFPSLLLELGLFPSAKDAKRNGWNRNLEVGDFLFKKKTYILRIKE